MSAAAPANVSVPAGKSSGGLVGALFGLALRCSFWLVSRFVSLHVRYPFHAAAVWVLFLLSQVLNSPGFWPVPLLAAAAWGVCFWKFWDAWKVRHWQYQQRRRVASVMAGSLWKDVEPRHMKRFAAVGFPSPGVARVRLSTPPGHDDAQVLKTLPQFRSALGLVSTIVLPDDDERDGVIEVMFCWVNPLETVLDGDGAPVLHLTDEQKADPFHWLPVGIDSSGQPMELPLFIQEGGSVRQLTAGASGSGKSSIVRQQLIQAVLCPAIDVMILDGKGSEFGAFRPYVEHFGTTPKDFWAQLRFLEEERDRRASILQANKDANPDRLSQSWNHLDDGPMLLWVWDELGAIMGGFDSRERSEAMGRLYGVLSVFRSLGVAVIWASQTFKADIITTQLRDNCFDLAIGFKMNAYQESAYLGFDTADEIRPDLIRGRLLKSGRSSTVGTFAARGLGPSTYGRSYFVPESSLRAALHGSTPIERKSS